MFMNENLVVDKDRIGDCGPDSDVDVLVDFIPGRIPDILRLI
jgi:predicted nucleotidyltransferase